MKSNDKNKKCNFSDMGCAIYEDPICDVLWYKGYYTHNNNDTS